MTAPRDTCDWCGEPAVGAHWGETTAGARIVDLCRACAEAKTRAIAECAAKIRVNATRRRRANRQDSERHAERHTEARR